MDRRKALILLTAVIATAILGGVVFNAYSADIAEETGDNSATWVTEQMMMPAPCGGRRGGMRGPRGFEFIEVSEEYEENVLNIAKSDTDVQALLSDGYNITQVRPIIKTVVEADGTVVTKAASAVVMLEKDTTGYAAVSVDVEEAKVTQIVIITKTVIEKP